MIPESRDLSYESRLLQCGLTTLETRRLRGDQIEVFKIVNGYEDVDRNMFFKLKEGNRTRGHKAALVKEQCRLDMRKYSFSQRVINEWNKLPNDCVSASSVNMFQNRIDTSDKGGLHIEEKIVGLSISQWLPCPLAIWNLLFEMAILLNLRFSLFNRLCLWHIHFLWPNSASNNVDRDQCRTGAFCLIFSLSSFDGFTSLWVGPSITVFSPNIYVRLSYYKFAYSRPISSV